MVFKVILLLLFVAFIRVVMGFHNGMWMALSRILRTRHRLHKHNLLRWGSFVRKVFFFVFDVLNLEKKRFCLLDGCDDDFGRVTISSGIRLIKLHHLLLQALRSYVLY